MPTGFRDPLGRGKITPSRSDSDGFYALRVFLKPDLDDGNSLGRRHLGTDWNANHDSDELAYASYGGKVAYASKNAGSDRGGVVMLNHTLPDGSKYTTVYMHLEHIPKSILDGTIKSVSRGELLGDSGFVKAGWGLHIHYEVREGHQTGLAGVGFGYHGGAGQGTLIGTGVTSSGIDYGDVRNPNGSVVRYLDPVEFTDKFRTLADSVSARPDLVIQNAQIDDKTVRVGQEVRADWEVKNIGPASADKSVAGVYLSRDDEWNKSTDIRVDSNSTDALAAGAVDKGQSDTFTIPNISSGTWYVLIVADDGKLISESSESNNVWSKKITVRSSSGNLSGDNLATTPDQPTYADLFQPIGQVNGEVASDYAQILEGTFGALPYENKLSMLGLLSVGSDPWLHLSWDLL